MPIPLIPIIAALAAGGSLVPHAAGGMIVTAASGYVAGTYISTAAILSLMGAATATLGTCAAIVTGAASAAIGGAGIFGTTIGATGLIGVLMSAGILPSTPIVVPLAAGGVALGGSYVSYQIYKLYRKVRSSKDGEEIVFTEKEAKIVEAVIKWMSKRNPSA